MLGFVPMAGDE